MKSCKKILSIVLALVLLVSSVSTVMCASASQAKSGSAPYEESAVIDTLIQALLGEYSDGEKLVSFVDQAVASSIEGKIVFDESNRHIIKALDESVTAGPDSSIDEAVAKYLGGGDSIIAMGDEKLMELLNTQKILGVPIMQLRYVQNLDTLVKTVILADNSDVLKMAAQTVAPIFGEVDATYESIISCLVPILSAFDFSALMAEGADITAALQVASPSAFAYLAGLESEFLDPDYLSNVNTALINNGYTGGKTVEPILVLSPEKQAQLLGFVEMEKGQGKPLLEIAQAGFNWKDFAGDTNKLDIANAMVKIALGDANKLGPLAANPDVGQALSALLCDLFNDLQVAPVTTLLDKISNGEGLSALADMAFGILNKDDSSFKSYENYFTRSLFADGQGNKAFYVKYDENGDPYYAGPKGFDAYLPVVDKAVKFLNGLLPVIQANGGDLLKTLFVDKLPELSALIKSALSYVDADGNEMIGILAYFLNDYKSYYQAQNASACDDIIISVANVAISEAQKNLAEKDAEIAIWQQYLAQAEAKENAVKLAKAKELGLLDESVTTYDEAAVIAAAEAKAAAIHRTMDELSGSIAQDEQDISTATKNLADAQQAVSDFQTWLQNDVNDYIENSSFHDYVSAIIVGQDISSLDDFHTACQAEFDALLGDGSFDEFASLISDNYEGYDYTDEDEGLFATDDFIEDYIYSGGLSLYSRQAPLDAEVKNQQTALKKANDNKTLHEYQLGLQETELAKYEPTETVINAINAEIEKDENKLQIADTNIGVQGKFSSADIRGAINTIETVDKKTYNDTIASEEAKIEEAQNDKAEQESFIKNYGIDKLFAQQAALDTLVDSVMVFLGGDEKTKSLYEYFELGQPIEMIAASDRVAALRGIIDNVINIFGEQLSAFLPEEFTLAPDYMDRIWAVEGLLFGENGVLSTLYDDFAVDPVIAIISRVSPIASIAEELYGLGLYQEVFAPYVPLLAYAKTLFGDNSEGFIACWNTPYADGSARHHYINALISLVPKLITLYDEVKEIEAVKQIVEPYGDIIDLALSFLSKSFYDDILSDGFLKTLLKQDTLEKIYEFAVSQIEEAEPENKDLILTLVGSFYRDVLLTFYDDLVKNPADALVYRINVLGFMVQMLPYYIEDFDLSQYDGYVSKQFLSGYLSMIPAEYQELVPGNIIGTITLFVRTIAFGPQLIYIPNSSVKVDGDKFFYFVPDEDGTYTLSVDTEELPENVYFDGKEMALTEDEETGRAILSFEAKANDVLEINLADEQLKDVNILLYNNAHEHNGEMKQVKAASCLEDGLQEGYCTICAKTVSEVIPATGHTPAEAVKENEVAATCTEAGSYDSVVYCSVCQALISKESVGIPALDHDWGEWMLTTPAGCNDAGLETRVCKRDPSHKETRAVDPTGHKAGEATRENEVAATCETAGSYDLVARCSVCQAILGKETKSIPALGHDWGAWQTTVAADCEKAGSEQRVCARDASHVEVREIKALGHSAAAAVRENEKAASCTAEGSYDEVVYCSVCQKVLSKQTKAIAKLDHIPAAAVKENEKAATCTAQGSYDKVVKCAVCGTELSRETVTVAAKGHSFKNTKVVKPTAVKAGYTDQKCSVCGKKQRVITAPTGKVSKLKCKTRTANAETITWSAVKGAQGYQIQISSANGKSWGKTYNAKKATSYSIKKLTAGGSYLFRVRIYAKDVNGKLAYGAWSKNLTSPTLPAGTSLSKVTGASKAFTAQWKQNKTITGYQIQYALDKNFKKSVKTVTVKGAGNLKTTVKKLNAKKDYFVRVRTYKTVAKVNYYSAWSKTVKVKTK